MQPSLSRALFHQLRDQAPDDIKYTAIAVTCLHTLALTSCSIYRLDRAEGVYWLVGSAPSNITPDVFVTLHNPAPASPHVPVYSAPNTLVGWLEYSRPSPLTTDELDFLLLLADFISSDFELSWLTNLLHKITQPVSVNQSLEDYADQLAALVGEPAQSAYTLIRQIDQRQRTLRCIGLYTRSSRVRLDKSDISITQDDPLFARLMSVHSEDAPAPSACRLYSDVNAGVLQRARVIMDDPAISTILVAPLRVGDIPVGTVNFAYHIITDFTNREQDVFLTIANHLGAALSNFVQTEKVIRLRQTLLLKFHQALSVDLLHGLRHAARNSLFSARNDFTSLRQSLQTRHWARINVDLTDLDANLQEVGRALESMTAVAQFRNDKFTLSRVDEVFQSACELVRQQLTEAEVNVKNDPGSKTLALMQTDTMRYAFVNLLLNSIDSLGRGKKQGRQITLHITSDASRLHMTFSDNGLGLQLRPPAITRLDDIWLVGRTTKDGGTGYGLPMVREVIQEIHGGSIAATETRKGMSFGIDLPRYRPGEEELWKEELAKAKVSPDSLI